jgi:hypothetical protein
VRTALATTLLTLAAAAVMPVGLAQAAAAGPTPAQMRAEIAHAEASRSLWATINICDSPRYPNTLGIRGEMPALGFATWMSMQIQLNSYSAAKHRFEPVSRVSVLVRLGRIANGLQQAGTTWTFKPHTGLLDATIQFSWRRSGKLLGQAARTTTADHPDADFGSPSHFSARQCQIR